MNDHVKTAYLDHHILIDEAGWEKLHSMVDRGAVRVTLSSWNIRELAQGMRQREERLGFIQSLAPRFIHDMLILQRFETASFLNEFFFRRGPCPFKPFAETFSEFLRGSFGLRTMPDYSLLDYIRAEGCVTGDIVDQRKVEHMEAMRAQLADQAALARLDQQTFHAKMATLIPHRDPRSQPWETYQIADMLSFCFEHRDELRRACPAVFVEEALSNARLVDPNRKPRDSDTGDLFHGVLALSYVDFFVGHDKWAMARAKTAKATVERVGLNGATLVQSLDELERALDVG